MNIADAITQALASYQVDTIFGVPGGQTLALYHSIAKTHSPIRHVTVLDERTGSYAADAYARASGRLGVCDGTVGPGATNLVSGLAEALNSSSPVLAIVSELQSETLHLAEWGSASQGSDQVALLRPVCKAVYAVHQPHELPYLLNRAIATALGGRPGPVALIVPMDIFETELTPSRLGTAGLNEAAPPPRSIADPESIGRAAELIVASKRPLIIAGGGAVAADASDAVLHLAESMDAPVASTWTGKGIIADDHKLALGVLGASAGMPGADRVAREADLVLMIGNKSAQNSTFRWTFPSAEQKLVHIDVDPLETGRVFRTDARLVGDAQLVATQLANAIDALNGRRDADGWIDRCCAVIKSARDELASQSASDAIPIAPQRVVAELAAIAKDDDILVCDASFSSAWGAMFFPVKKAGRRCIFPRGMAGLGFGLPAALGAAAARRDAQVFLLAGDGGFAYSVQELAVAVRNKLRVRAVVINNTAYGWIKHSYRARFGGALPQNELPKIDFCAVALGFGCQAERVERPDQLAGALARAELADGPFLIEVIASVEESPVTSHRQAKKPADPYASASTDPYAAN